MFVSGTWGDLYRSDEGRLLQDGYFPKQENFFATLRPGDRKIVVDRNSQKKDLRVELLRDILAENGF